MSDTVSPPKPTQARATYTEPTPSGVIETAGVLMWEQSLAPADVHRLMFLACEGTTEAQWESAVGQDPNVDYLKWSTGVQTERFLKLLGVSWRGWNGGLVR